MRTIKKQPRAISKANKSNFLESKYWSVNDSADIGGLEISLELISNRLRTQALLGEIALPVPESKVESAAFENTSLIYIREKALN
ncbi:hypothetical protein [Myxosarcina sp. GI1]|uniref:hypothetical protein n=1 Tax=Myxosarcina sp. GI1 TaxID=1541065 RepID=UPI00055DA7E5|nr:hypothetical protein [Myxosarcina sp. GI1]